MHRNATVFSHALLAVTSGWALHASGGFSTRWTWCHPAFAVMLFNSITGIFRYSVNSKKLLEDAYNISLYLRSVVALPCFTCYMYFMYGMTKEVAHAHTLSCAVLVGLYLLGESRPDLVDLVLMCNVLSLGYISLAHDNYFGLNVAVTFAYAHFIVRNQHTYMDFPAIDFNNYCMCFFNYFAIRASQD